MYLPLFGSYLHKRKQFLYLNGFCSNIYLGTTGVPQWSNLGPLLFLLSNNELCDVIKTQKLLFADDFKFFSSIHTLKDCIALQNQLIYVQNWGSKNRLYWNISKCKVITFSRKTSTVQYPVLYFHRLLNNKVYSPELLCQIECS